jgi:hypothetical protein
MAGPSPDPDRPRELEPRWKRSKIWPSSSAGTPGPWSRTTTSPSRTVTSTTPPGGRWRRARSTASATSTSSRTSSTVTSRCSSRASSITSPTSSQLLGLLHHVGEQRASLGGRQVVAVEQDFRVRAQRRHRRAQLVRRVRDELPLRGPLEYRAVARGRPGPASAPTLSCVVGTMTGTTASLAAA